MLRVFVSSLIALKGGREYLVITYAPFAFCAFLFFRLCVCSGASTSGGGVGCGGVDPPLAWCNYDTLHLYVLDHLSCPAMATQYERVLSTARRTLTPERGALGLKVLEACECPRWWWRNGVATGTATADQSPAYYRRMQKSLARDQN